MSVEQRANLCLLATTSLDRARCYELVCRAVQQAKPGANYAGQGLTVEIVGDASIGAGVLTMFARSDQLCEFALATEVEGDITKVQLGPLATYRTIRSHVILFFSITEIAGYGYYKRILAAARDALCAADSGCQAQTSIVADASQLLA